MGERGLKVVAFLPVFVVHLIGSFVAWALAPGNTATELPLGGLRHLASGVFGFPLIDLLPADFVTRWFELLILLNSALCAAALVWIGFRLFRRHPTGPKL